MSKKRAARRDDDVDRARTIYWFRYVGVRLQTHTPREIQRILAPKTIGLADDGEPIKNSKFLGYSQGEHVPRAVLVERAECMAPRSSRALNHPLWQVLRQQGSIAKQAPRWVRELDPEIQGIVMGPYLKIPLGPNLHTVGSLERRAGLDSLAALTIMLRLSHEQGKDEWVWLYAQTAFRVLLMIWPHLELHDVAERVFGIYVQRVFCLAAFDGLCMDLQSYNYPVMAQLLNELADRASEDNASGRERRMPTYYALQVLNGQCGSRFKKLFQIPLTAMENGEKQKSERSGEI